MKLKLAEGLSLPLDAVTQTFAILAITDEERRTGVSEEFKQHRWQRPIRIGDHCRCGERVADAVLADVLNR